jgi:hypothetical protein
MKTKHSNLLRIAEWKIKSALGISFEDTTKKNFELIKEWDFTKMDFPTLQNDFRFSPPWGDMVNQNQNSKFSKDNIKLTSEGISFITTKVDDSKVPYRVGGISTKKDFDLPAFGRIEAEITIPQFEGQWPALWTVDPVGTMPEFDLFEYFWPSGTPNANFEGNLHWGTSYNSKKYKYSIPTTFPLSLLDKPIKIVGEFYPNESIYYLNNFPFWKSERGYSPNKKIVILGGGTHNLGGPLGQGPWVSLKCRYMKFYKLSE